MKQIPGIFLQQIQQNNEICVNISDLIISDKRTLHVFTKYKYLNPPKFKKNNMFVLRDNFN